MTRTRRDEAQTVKLTVDQLLTPSWATVVMLLERIGPDAAFALRLGLIEQAHRVLDEMAHVEAKPEMVVKLRAVVDALGHMPWDLA